MVILRVPHILDVGNLFFSKEPSLRFFHSMEGNKIGEVSYGF